MLRTVGVITTCQKINDLDWKRPELKSIQAGIIADGLGCIIGGLMGVIGMNSAVGPVGVAKAAGATSRYIGFSCAAILIIFALVPKYAALFLIMPQPVIGALMVFTASFMIAGGIQIIVSRSIDSRATYVVGVSLLLGLSRQIFPTYFERAVPLVHQFTGSMMSIGVLSAFLLNLTFRIGATRSATFEFEKSDTPIADLERLLRARGRAWSVPADVVDRAVASTGQVMQHLADADLIIGSPSLTMTYNDFDLTISVHYRGALLVTAECRCQEALFPGRGIFFLWIGRFSHWRLSGPDGGALGRSECRDTADIQRISPDPSTPASPASAPAPVPLSQPLRYPSRRGFAARGWPCRAEFLPVSSPGGASAVNTLAFCPNGEPACVTTPCATAIPS